MTPLQLCILLHYYYSAVDFRDGDFTAPAVRDAIDVFRSDYSDSPYETSGLLTDSTLIGQTYTLSERGRVYIDHLLDQPLPAQAWVMPSRVPPTP